MFVRGGLGGRDFMPWMERFHDAVTAGHVLWAALVCVLLSLCLLLVWVPMPRVRGGLVRKMMMGIAAGVVIACLSVLISSSDQSGTLLRTRRGLPHFFVVSNTDAETHAQVGRVEINPAHWTVNIIGWCSISILFVSISLLFGAGRSS